MRLTPAVKVLLIINLVFYILTDFITPLVPLNGNPDWFKLLNSLFPVGNPNFHIYQYLTYMFMHGGFIHLFFNMWQLFIFGPAIEQVYGSRRFALFYILCGIGSALANQLCVLLGIIAPALVVGASGAIYGVMIAAAFNFPNATLYIIPFPFPIKLKWLVVGFMAYDLFSGLTSVDGVAHFAHLGGALVGLAIVMLWKAQGINDGYTTSNGPSWFKRMLAKATRKPKVKMTVSYGGTHAAEYKYNERKKEENDEMDRILDKVKAHGYASLTAEEKERLFNASSKR